MFCLCTQYTHECKYISCAHSIINCLVGSHGQPVRAETWSAWLIGWITWLTNWSRDLIIMVVCKVWLGHKTDKMEFRPYQYGWVQCMVWSWCRQFGVETKHGWIFVRWDHMTHQFEFRPDQYVWVHGIIRCGIVIVYSTHFLADDGGSYTLPCRFGIVQNEYTMSNWESHGQEAIVHEERKMYWHGAN